MPSPEHMSGQVPAPSQVLVHCQLRGTHRTPRRRGGGLRASSSPPFRFIAALVSARAPSHPVHHAPATSGGFSLLPASAPSFTVSGTRRCRAGRARPAKVLRIYYCGAPCLVASAVSSILAVKRTAFGSRLPLRYAAALKEEHMPAVPHLSAWQFTSVRIVRASS